MHGLESRIPPPIVMAALGCAMWAVARGLSGYVFESRIAGVLALTLAVSGLVLNVHPKVAFRRVGTTVNPMAPASTTQLVSTGFYRFTRNPMYLGHGFILLGWALHLRSVPALLAVPAYMLYITRFQIRPEERALAARFQDEYAAFCRRTPRWL